MANIKSAKKRILVDRRNAERNKAVKSCVKTAVKKVYAAIEDGNKAEAEAALKNATSIISKAKSKGVFHAKTASRKISRLTLAVNKLD
ncbi:MAG: 30S ribosomal protein S20 [Lachnospiraceae bacterium]|nr:30S ribosomal protein S20 [Lachnospiraceae bacterium]